MKHSDENISSEGTVRESMQRLLNDIHFFQINKIKDSDEGHQIVKIGLDVFLKNSFKALILFSPSQ